MKTVLITGASGGIGSASAKSFAIAGYQVAIHYHKNQTSAEMLCHWIQEQGGRALIVDADLTSNEQVQAMFASVERKLGAVDVLVNNAGIAAQQLITDTTEQEWQQMMNVHVNGMFYCTKAVLSNMIRRKQGSIVNISSIWGIYGAACAVAYSTAKAAMLGFTQSGSRGAGHCGSRV